MIDKMIWVVSHGGLPEDAYDSLEDIVAQLSQWWGIDELTTDDILDMDFQDDHDIKISNVTYYKNIALERDGKIEEIIN